MKIREIHIDGFGVFAGQHVTDIGDGVVLFTGANEAGKTTLMSFVKAILFGHDSKAWKGHGEPLVGGRHGGAIVVVTGDGQVHRVERYAGDPDARASAGGIVGNMSKTLYSNIFAFGLEELETIKSLSSDEVRARIYSAGAGLGAAALPAARAWLDRRADELFKPSGIRPRINSLAAQAAEVESEIAEGRRRPAEYNAIIDRIDETNRELARVRSSIQGQSAMVSWLSSLVRTRDQWEKLCVAREQLDQLEREDALPHVRHVRDILLMYVAEVQLLQLEQSVHVKLLREAPALRASASERERTYLDRLCDLGPSWDEARLVSFDVSPGIEQEIAGMSRQYDDLKRSYDGAATRELFRKDEHKKAAEELESARGELEMRTKAAYVDMSASAGRLHLIDQAAALEREVESARLYSASASSAADEAARRVEDLRRMCAAAEAAQSRWRRAGALGAILMLVAGVAGAWGRPHASAFACIAAGAAAAAVLAIAARRASDRDAKASLGQKRALDEAARRFDELTKASAAGAAEHESVARRFEQVCLELFGKPTAAASEIAAARDAAVSAAAERAKIEELSNRVTRLEQAAAMAMRQWNLEVEARKGVAAQLEACQRAWAEWLRARNLDSTGYEGAAALVSAVREARRAHDDARYAGREAEQATRQLNLYAFRVNRIMAALGRADVDPEGAAAAVTGLASEVEEAARAREALEDARQRAMDIEIELEMAFPAGQRDRMRSEHGSSTLEQIAARLRGAEDALRRAEQEREVLLAKAGGYAADKRRIETEDELPAARAKLESYMAELRRSVHEWAAVSVCRTLLDRACDRYELQRQPAVMREAGHALSRMTSGRWSSVVVPLSEGLESMAAVDAHGMRRVAHQLSRGTEQQLYLAVRCGLVREYCSRAEPMPVMVDDILVNFDPQRASQAAEVLAALSDICQVFVFTCHPSTTEYFRRTGRPISEYSLEGGLIVRRPS